MQRTLLKSMQVVESCTSPVVFSRSPLCSVGKCDGGIVIATRFFPHLRLAMGSRSRISEWSPLEANRTDGLWALAACAGLPGLERSPPDAAVTAPAVTTSAVPSAQPATTTDRPPPLNTAREYRGAEEASRSGEPLAQGSAAGSLS